MMDSIASVSSNITETQPMADWAFFKAPIVGSSIYTNREEKYDD